MKLLEVKIILFAVFNLLILQAGQGESNRNSRASLDEQEIVTDSVTKGQVENRDEQLQADDTLVESGQVTTWYDYAKIAALVGLSLGVIGAVGYTNRDQINHLVDATKNWWHGYTPVSVYSAEQLAEFRADVERRKHELIVAWQKKFGADSKPLELGALSKENVKLYNEKRQWLKDHGVIPANDFEQNLYNPDGSIKGTASLSSLPLASTQKDEMRENRRLQQMLRQSLYDNNGALTEKAKQKLEKLAASEEIKVVGHNAYTQELDASGISFIRDVIKKTGTLSDTEKGTIEGMLLNSPEFMANQIVNNVEAFNEFSQDKNFKTTQFLLERKYSNKFLPDVSANYFAGGLVIGGVSGTTHAYYKTKGFAHPGSLRIIGGDLLKTLIMSTILGGLHSSYKADGYAQGLAEGAFSYQQIDAAPVVKVE